jgi:hypothetical protein
MRTVKSQKELFLLNVVVLRSKVFGKTTTATITVVV